MKKVLFVITSILILVAFVACTPASTVQPSVNIPLDSAPQSMPTAPTPVSSSPNITTTIKVIGNGEAIVSPDTANCYIDVFEYGDTTEEATRANAEKVEQVTQKLISEGILSEDIITQHYGVYPDYASGYYGDHDQIVGYNSSTSIIFSTTDKDNIGKYIDAVSEFDVGIGNAYFTLEDDTAGKELAMQDASKDAFEKATILAEASGRTVGRAVSITEGRTDDMSVMYGYMEPYASEAPMEETADGSAYSAPSTNITYDDKTIYFTVTIFYELV